MIRTWNTIIYNRKALEKKSEAIAREREKMKNNRNEISITLCTPGHHSSKWEAGKENNDEKYKND